MTTTTTTTLYSFKKEHNLLDLGLDDRQGMTSRPGAGLVIVSDVAFAPPRRTVARLDEMRFDRRRDTRGPARARRADGP